ncbi:MULTISPECIES: halo transducer protein [unclassified Halorubrum]|uniref:halo transducer protein n=1 Tax=unclassified Halorubrum TaxID=2642239 RepID=UPI0010F58D67|nr:MULTISPECIES: halo transducer protein [unclassified Halorubrum]TKX45254.1 halo transducer protein [Halorubrum sp. ARQ200]TKX51572.1 halo transducer protein [Halorubrum sp. ASP121]TKX61246.1 halo transducer protein [Halorubrum sp. ASP1]
MSRPATEDVSVDVLVDEVSDRVDADPESIRRRLDPVTDDGTVTAAAFESTVTDVSQILATAETRVDLATRAHEDATAAAADAPDLDVVEVRRRAFGARLDDLRAEVEALADDLGAARADPESPMDVYRAAVELHEVTTGAQDVVRVAHDLETELEAFEAWLSSANRRHDGLVDEVEAAEESAESLAETVEALRAAEEPDPERRFEAGVQARVLDLVVADLRAEAEDLRAWAERDGVAFPDDVDARLDELEAEVAAHGAALADGADRDDRFGERLDALDAELAAIEPPVAWARVDETVAEARSALSDDGGAPADRARQ